MILSLLLVSSSVILSSRYSHFYSLSAYQFHILHCSHYRHSIRVGSAHTAIYPNSSDITTLNILCEPTVYTVLSPNNLASLTLSLILPRSRMGTVWFYTSTSNKRAARPKLYTKSLTRDLKRMYSRFTLVRISINL